MHVHVWMIGREQTRLTDVLGLDDVPLGQLHEALEHLGVGALTCAYD